MRVRHSGFRLAFQVGPARGVHNSYPIPTSPNPLEQLVELRTSHQPRIRDPPARLSSQRSPGDGKVKSGAAACPGSPLPETATPPPEFPPSGQSRLERADKIIDDWYDSRIQPGSRWDNQIKGALEKSRLVLFLVTFLHVLRRYHVSALAHFLLVEPTLNLGDRLYGR